VLLSYVELRFCIARDIVIHCEILTMFIGTLLPGIKGRFKIRTRFLNVFKAILSSSATNLR
jgi:hypothetical protein